MLTWGLETRRPAPQHLSLVAKSSKILLVGNPLGSVGSEALLEANCGCLNLHLASSQFGCSARHHGSRPTTASVLASLKATCIAARPDAGEARGRTGLQVLQQAHLVAGLEKSNERLRFCLHTCSADVEDQVQGFLTVPCCTCGGAAKWQTIQEGGGEGQSHKQRVPKTWGGGLYRVAMLASPRGLLGHGGEGGQKNEEAPASTICIAPELCFGGRGCIRGSQGCTPTCCGSVPVPPTSQPSRR
jgi:hypothetical protein